MASMASITPLTPNTVEIAIGAVLAGSISEITQRSIYRRLGALAQIAVVDLSEVDRRRVLSDLESSVRLFARNGSTELMAACTRALAAGPTVELARSGLAVGPKRLPIDAEKDIAAARLDAWSEAVRLGLSKFKSVKVATAVSELARNIVFYAGRGMIELRPRLDEGEPRLEIVARDSGPGIDPAKLQTIFAGTYRSDRGMGKGLAAVKKLTDEFAIETAPGRGTVVTCAFQGER
jgi:serine/threonine-protein kinase RsbT